MNPRFLLLAALAACTLSACQTGPSRAELQRRREAMLAKIPLEPAGNYFIGRRVYKVDYKMWGYLRKPRESWADARLVVLNENKTYAPDRAANDIGSDNDCEYKVWGRFSGDTVYEPASNGFWPEFVLERMELVSKEPGPIFKDRKATDPKERYYPAPY